MSDPDLRHFDAPSRMNSSQPVIVRVTRQFDASAERVFDAWLDPDMIGRWMFGTNVREEEVVRIALDPRIGGTFSFLVRRQADEINHIGRYLVIDRPRRMVFTWGIAGESEDESRVIIEIAVRAAGCELTLTHELDPQWKDFADATETGWNTMLAALAGELDRIHG